MTPAPVNIEIQPCQSPFTDTRLSLVLAGCYGSLKDALEYYLTPTDKEAFRAFMREQPHQLRWVAQFALLTGRCVVFCAQQAESAWKTSNKEDETLVILCRTNTIQVYEDCSDV